MRSPRRRHVLAVTTLATATAVFAQPARPTVPAPGADDIDEPVPAQASAAAQAQSAQVATAIAPWQPGPPTVAVTPFENHVVNGKSVDWIIAEAPFEIAEKAENVLGLEPALPPLYVVGERIPPDPDTVNDFAKKTDAMLVVTGWFDRIGENIRLAVLVWKRDTYGKNAKVVGEAQRMGPPAQYHRVLGEAMAEAFNEADIIVDDARAQRLTRALSSDIYPVFMMGRGLGHFTGALEAMDAFRALTTAGTGASTLSSLLPTPQGSGSGSGAAAIMPDLESAQHDLERAVFLDPKLFEAQRLLGELYMATAAGDPKLVAKATGKFSYAADLAPDDAPSLRAAAFAMARAGKHDVALDLFTRVVTKRPWDLDARYELGAALWQSGDAIAAERQLEQVTAHRPDHLQARRVLVLIHASRNDTPRLIRELEAIEQRLPQDLEVKSDLASAYGAVNNWPKAIAALERIAQQRPNDLPLLVRIGDAHRRHGSLDTALQWYARAAKLNSETSLPGFASAQALFDAGRLDEAARAYTLLQKYTADRYAAVHAIGVIAYLQNQPSQAAWNLREAVKNAPRQLASRRALVAAELARKDASAALVQVTPALLAWPNDAQLHYLAGLAHALGGDANTAREELGRAVALEPAMPAATAALATLNAGGAPTVDFKPELVRPWGDGEALQAMLDRYDSATTAMAQLRAKYQHDMLDLIGSVGSGPLARAKPGSVKTCPAGQIAPTWARAQQELSRYARLGLELETAYRFLVRHDEAGLTAALLPNSRTALAAAKKGYRIALADMGELRAEWSRGVTPELRAAGCSDKLLAAAAADPQRYKVIAEDKPEPIPTRPPPRAKPRTTFFVDNTRCADPVDVWIDGAHVGQVSPGRRSALVADGGERTLCLLMPGGAQCGDRGTVRQVYLHDGWSTTLYCPK
jgi:tetratricopeptide (TPR) repeat protein